MFDRFTDRARQAMGLAYRAASQRFQHDYIGTEHMLLGLLDASCTALDLLHRLGVHPWRLRDDATRAMKLGRTPPQGRQLPFTPNAKRALEMALGEASVLGVNHIGTEHLLLGLLRAPGLAGKVLRKAGVTLEKARAALADLEGAPPPPAPANIELKARCGDLDGARDAAIAHGAAPGGTLQQQDTYYGAAQGRLKLRRIDDVRAELISYRRPDEAAVRRSDYRIVPVSDPHALHEALDAALGVRRVVTKTRELFFWENVRIHLDTVEGLGTFVEFEAVLGPDADEELSRNRLVLLRAALGIRDEDLVAGSYADI